MKMRGYSVLFVCALCVFVLCGAAAVVAQQETPGKAVEAAKDDADTAKRKGNEVLGTHEAFTRNVSSVVSGLTLAIEKITASKIQAGEINRTEDQKKERILRKIDRLKTKAEAAKTPLEALSDVGAATFKDEQTKRALTNKMNEEAELYMMVMEKAAAAVTGNISAIDAVIEEADALETAAKEAGYLWYDVVYEFDRQLSNAMAAVSAVETTITATEGFLNLFEGSSDPEAQKVNKELSDAVENILKPSMKKLISLRNASQKAKMAAREATDQYILLREKAKKLKEAAEGWKLRAVDAKAVEAAKAMADTAKAEGELALGTQKEFASDVSSVVSSLTLAVEKITASKIPAGKIIREIKDIEKERILRKIDRLKTKAVAAKTAVEELRDGEAETFKDDQTKTALADRMKEVELYMTEVEKAADAVTGNIFAIDAVIEEADALETAAKEAGYLWLSASSDFDRQLLKAGWAVSAVETMITATEGFLNLFDGSSDPEAQKVNKGLSDAVENILKPSVETLIYLRYASQKAKMAAREATDQYILLREKAKKLKETAEGWKLRAVDAKAVEAAKAMADTAKTKGGLALGTDKEFARNVSSVVSSLTLALEKISALKIPAGKIIREIKDIEKERILRDIDRLKTKAVAAKTPLEALRDGEAETLKDDQTKTALTDRMKEVELYMTEVEKAAAAVTGNIFAFEDVIEEADALETAAKEAGYLWYDVAYDFDRQLSNAMAAVSAVETMITATEGFLNLFEGSSDPEAQKVKEELSDAVENILKPSVEKLIYLRYASQNKTEAAREATDQYILLREKAKKLKEASEDWKQNAADVKAVEAAKAMADTAKAEGELALGTQKEFASDVSSVVSSLTLAVEKITASKIQAGEINRTEDQKKEQILREIDRLKTKGEAAKTPLEALSDVGAATFMDEQTKTALTNKMNEVELYMMVMEKAAAAVTRNISAIDAVIEEADALETAAKEAGYLWYDVVYDFDRQLSNAMAAVSAVETMITATEGFLNLFEGSSDPEAQKVNKELSDAVENILKPSMKKLISLRNASQKAKMAAREATDQYDELEEKAEELKEAAEDWKQKTVDAKAVEAARAMADVAKAKGELALGTQKEFASGVSSVVSSLTLAVEKITTSKIQAGEINRTEDQKKEQILREIDRLKTKAVAAKTPLEALRDVGAETFKDEQTKTALTNKMNEVELYMTEVEKAAAAVTRNISAIDAVIEEADALETAAKEAGYLWYDVVYDFDRQLSNAMAAVSAVETMITATEGFLNLFEGSSDPEAQKVNKELSDAVENILKPSVEKLIYLRYASQKAKMAAREATDQYILLREKAKKLKETAEGWKLRAADVKAVEAAKAMVDVAKTKGEEALGTDKEFANVVSSVVPSLTLAVKKITASKIPAGKIIREIKDIEKERILRDIDRLKTKAVAAKTAVEELRDGEAAILKDEQTKTALTNKMKEVELYMMEVEKAAAAVTGNISAIDAVIEKAGALETAARETGYLWLSAVWDLMIQFSSAMAAASATITVKVEMESAVTKLGGNNDPEAQKVNKELLDIIESILKPSVEKLIYLRDASQKAKMAARETSAQYMALREKAKKLKEAAEGWKQKTADVRAVEAAKADADTAQTKGDEALGTQKEFASDVSSVVSSLTLAVRKITASKIPAGKIMQEIKDIKKERILRKIDRLKTKAVAAKTAVEALRDGEAETFKDKQTKTALTNKMNEEAELYMMVMEKAAAAVTGNISAIDAVIEKAGALEAVAKEAGYLWHFASDDFDRQFFNAVAAVSAVYTTITATEGFLNLFDGSSDPEAQKMKEELLDAVENILKPSMKKLMSLRDVSEKGKLAAREATDQYYELREKAKKLKETAEGWKQNAEKVLQEGGQVSQDPPPSAAN